METVHPTSIYHLALEVVDHPALVAPRMETETDLVRVEVHHHLHMVLLGLVEAPVDLEEMEVDDHQVLMVPQVTVEAVEVVTVGVDLDLMATVEMVVTAVVVLELMETVEVVDTAVVVLDLMATAEVVGTAVVVLELMATVEVVDTAVVDQEPMAMVEAVVTVVAALNLLHHRPLLVHQA